eukprot:356739-Chlamydomonas_euryale.AAC.2
MTGKVACLSSLPRTADDCPAIVARKRLTSELSGAHRRAGLSAQRHSLLDSLGRWAQRGGGATVWHSCVHFLGVWAGGMGSAKARADDGPTCCGCQGGVGSSPSHTTVTQN